MKNIHILPTDKPSRLIHNDANQLCYQSNKSFKNDRKWMYRKKFNIYITNSEEIKEGDWFITNNNEIFKCIKNKEEQCFYSLNASILTKFCKKIILTTDTDLIKDGVQTIDNEFLEWFVMNPSCEEVETKVEFIQTSDNLKDGFYYRIIIPKEEQCTCKEHDPYCCQIHGNCPTCVKKEEPKQEKLTYTESAKKEERISNCTMMKRKRETLEEDDQTLAEIKERMKTRELEKTAVEWLIDWMKANQYFIGNDLLEAVHTAKAMEYFQNKKMYERGAEDFVKKVNQLSKPSSNE